MIYDDVGDDDDDDDDDDQIDMHGTIEMPHCENTIYWCHLETVSLRRKAANKYSNGDAQAVWTPMDSCIKMNKCTEHFNNSSQQ